MSHFWVKRTFFHLLVLGSIFNSPCKTHMLQSKMYNIFFLSRPFSSLIISFLPVAKVLFQITYKTLSFKTVLQLSLPSWRALCPRWPEQWMCRHSYKVSLINGHFKTIFHVELLITWRIHLPRGHNSDCNLPTSITTKWPVISQWVPKITLLMEELCVPKDLNNDCA